MYSELAGFLHLIPLNHLFDMFFIGSVSSTFICIVHSGARVAQVRFRPGTTPQDINVEQTACLMEYRKVYTPTFVAFMIMIYQILLGLKPLFL
jgi:hypothetical protein